MERIAEKSAQNLVDEIAASKKNSLARLIYAIGIPSRWRALTGQLLACSILVPWRNWQVRAQKSLLKVGEVGIPKIAEGVREFFSESANRKLIDRLREPWA